MIIIIKLESGKEAKQFSDIQAQISSIELRRTLRINRNTFVLCNASQLDTIFLSSAMFKTMIRIILRVSRHGPVKPS